MSENNQVGHVPNNVVEKLEYLTYEFIFLLLFLAMIAWGVLSLNVNSMTASEGAYGSYEEARDAKAIEAGHQAGYNYNWTAKNITVFESIYQEDGLFKEEITYAEVQCANGMQESCDYIYLEYEVDDSSWGGDGLDGFIIFILGEIVILLLSLVILSKLEKLSESRLRAQH